MEERDGFCCYHAKDHYGVASPDDSQHARQTQIGGWIGPSKFSPRFKVLSMQNTAPHRTAPHHTAPQAPGLTFGPILNAVRALAGSRVLWLAGPLGYRAPLRVVGAPAGAGGLLRSTVCFRQYLPSTISWLRTCFETPRPTCIKPACDVTHRPRFRQGASICGCTDPWRRPHGMNLD